MRVTATVFLQGKYVRGTIDYDAYVNCAQKGNTTTVSFKRATGGKPVPVLRACVTIAENDIVKAQGPRNVYTWYKRATIECDTYKDDVSALVNTGKQIHAQYADKFASIRHACRVQIKRDKRILSEDDARAVRERERERSAMLEVTYWQNFAKSIAREGR